MPSTFLAAARWLALAAASAAAASAAGATPAASPAPEIWFAPHSPQPNMSGPDDWDRLFDPGAGWPSARAHTKIFGFDIGYLDSVPDETLRARVAELRRRGIGVMVTLQAIAFDDPITCGRGVEGFYDARRTAADADKLRRAGADVRAISLDGPLDFGHYYDGPQACRLPLPELARRVALNLAAMTRAFPDALVGDVEGSGLARRADIATTYPAWTRALADAAGRRLDFLCLDVDWPGATWREDVLAQAARARALGLRLGVIYNGDGLDRGDRQWIEHAAAHFQEIESGLGVIPELALFAGWNRFPTHLLPESADTAMTYLITRYLLPRARIAMRPDGARGWLRDQAGHPVAGARIEIAVGGARPGAAPPEHSTEGTVPAAARAAILGWRINTECACASAPVDARLGALRYRESGLGAAREVARYTAQVRDGHDRDAPSVSATLEAAAGETVARVVTDASHRVMFNSRPFAVTPGAEYSFTAEVGTTLGRALPGYATIIWLDAAGRGLGRVTLEDRGDYFAAGGVTTDARGGFTLARPRDASGAIAPLRLRYAGDARLRPAFLDLP